MTVLQATRTKASSGATRSGRLFLLELSGDRIHSMNPDGSDRNTIVTKCHLPDGIVVDEQAGHIYWTNMGIPNLDDGSIERADLDGGNRMVIVPQGVTHTPKQIHLDKDGGKLYWCDREGMRVMRANLDGSHVEALVETGHGDEDRRDQTRWCVGITTDPKFQKIYWTQKGSSVPPTWTPPCAGDRACAGESRATRRLITSAVALGGIEHFFQQFTGPMTAWWKTLGSPVLTPEVQKKLIDSVHAEVGSRSIEDLEAERDDILLGLLELRAKRPDVDQHKSQPSSEAAAVTRN